MTDRWLLDQLPRPMAEDPFLERFLHIFEEVAGSVRQRADGLEHYLDLGTAPPEFLWWMAGWLGLSIRSSLSTERQRALLRAAGPLFPWRGTRRGLEGLLEAFTSSQVEIEDSGGVFQEGGAPGGAKEVTIRLADPGGIEEQQLLRLVQGEVPADAHVELRVAGHEVEEALAEDEPIEEAGDEEATSDAEETERAQLDEDESPELSEDPEPDGD